MAKPEVKVRDAVVIMGYMFADLAEPHPTYGWPVGKEIRSSIVLEISPDQKTIETKNTIYKVVD